jgi:HTH-type transcriptional regulator / antitoxin HipB
MLCQRSMTFGSGQRIRTPVDLGLVIRERRRALGLDQLTLAVRVGVSRQWIVEIEQGKTRAGVGLVLRTLQALGLEATIGSGASSGAGSKSGVTALDLEAIDIDAVVENARAGTGAFAPLPPTARRKKSSARPASMRRANKARSRPPSPPPPDRRRR